MHFRWLGNGATLSNRKRHSVEIRMDSMRKCLPNKADSDENQAQPGRAPERIKIEGDLHRHTWETSELILTGPTSS